MEFFEEKNDEWYTQIKDIEDEVNNHKSSFNGKIIYCNCDDNTSQFYKYFKSNFQNLGLKGLYCTSIRGTYTSYDGVNEKIRNLKDGSFQNNEKLIQKCDIVVSNPPFSLFTQYMTMLVNSGKGFLILGPVRSGYALRKYFDGGQMHFGTARPMYFDIPNEEPKQLRNCGWYTNLDSDVEIKRHTRVLSDKDFEDINNRDIITIPAMYMPNIDKNGVLKVNDNGEEKQYKVIDYKRINDSQKVILQRISENKKNIIFNENQIKLLKEYLDKDYGKPLYDFLTNNEKYNNYGYFNNTYKLIPFFFVYLAKFASDEDFKKFREYCKNDEKLKERILFNLYPNRNINFYTLTTKGFERVGNRKEYLETNSKKLFNKFNFEPIVLDIWDRYFIWLNQNADYKFLRTYKDYFNSEMILSKPQDIIKPTQWLFHFTEAPEKIAKEGFIKGFGKKNFKQMAYTKSIQSSDKENEYGYAYDCKDIIEDNFFYGDKMFAEKPFEKNFDVLSWRNAMRGAVMFKANGVKTYHASDVENQVIFPLNTARDFVVLKRDWHINDGNIKHPNDTRRGHGKYDIVWNVIGKKGQVLYYNDTISEVVKWVMNNFR